MFSRLYIYINIYYYLFRGTGTEGSRPVSNAFSSPHYVDLLCGTVYSEKRYTGRKDPVLGG